MLFGSGFVYLHVRLAQLWLHEAVSWQIDDLHLHIPYFTVIISHIPYFALHMNSLKIILKYFKKFEIIVFMTILKNKGMTFYQWLQLVGSIMYLLVQAKWSLFSFLLFQSTTVSGDRLANSKCESIASKCQQQQQHYSAIVVTPQYIQWHCINQMQARRYPRNLK